MKKNNKYFKFCDDWFTYGEIEVDFEQDVFQCGKARKCS